MYDRTGIVVKHTARRLSVAAALLVSGSLLTACGGGGGSASEDGDTTTIQLGTYPNSVLSLPQVVAEGEGFFADEGLEVEPINGKTGPELVSTLIGGTTQIAGASTGTAIPALEQGQKLTVFPPFQKENKAILVPEESGLSALEDLEGKKIAVPARGGDAESFAVDVMEEQGVDPSAVTFVATGAPGTMQAALTNGTVDAGVLTVSAINQMRSNGTEVVAVANSLDGSAGKRGEDGLAAFFITTDDYWGENPDTVEAFCRAMRTTTEFIADDANRDAVAGYIAEYIGVDEENSGEIYDNYRDSWTLEIDESLWEKNVRYISDSAEIPFDIVENGCGA